MTETTIFIDIYVLLTDNHPGTCTLGTLALIIALKLALNTSTLGLTQQIIIIKKKKKRCES